ncbi:MAG: ATP-binding protein [Lewinellaceae bacterium]|nr:ATP-binding protein [Lewinellaceae bacterium]MCB9291490.1 ATP-binding protein [Lewinellaceae bacterium]
MPNLKKKFKFGIKVIYPRYIATTLLQRLQAFPVVGITGPRQAGKTTLVKSLLPEIEKETAYLDLELPSDLARLRNAELFLKENEQKLIIIDEVQRKPDLFPLLRSLVDLRREPGRFLILGSASPELLRQSSETLAGRISYLELTPFHFRELPDDDIKKHWLRGGFPPALFAQNNETAFQWLEDFVITFVERDLPQFGLTAPSQTLQTLLQMLGSAHGNLINFSTLANSLGVAMPTVKRYMSYLENAYFIRYLQPWHTNVKKRLVKTPKVFFRDTGVLHYLTGISEINQLYGHQIVGASWEGYVLQQIIANLPSRTLPYFYRTRSGAELDLILIKGSQPVLAVEVKFSSTPSLRKGNHLAIADIGSPPTFIIVPSGGDYPLEENIRVCGLEQFWDYLP